MSKTLQTQADQAKTKHVSFSDKPVVGSNLQRVGNYDKGDRVVQYHFAAERCGNLSVWCAAMAGAELIKKKKETPRGSGFMTYLEQLPFSNGTAHNYMNLAKKLEEKLLELPEDQRMALLPELANAQKATESALQLLNLPSPMDVFNPAHERIADLIRTVTSEHTLRQLYFDWDIIKPPAQKGGLRRALSPVEKHEREVSENEDIWRRIIAEIEMFGLQDKTCCELPKQMRKRLLDVCIQLNHVLRESM